MNTHRSIYIPLTTNSRLVFGYNLIKLSDLDKSSAVDQFRMWTIEQTDNRTMDDYEFKSLRLHWTDLYYSTK